MGQTNRVTRVLYEWVPVLDEAGVLLREERKSVTYTDATFEQTCAAEDCTATIRRHAIYRSGGHGAGRPLNADRRICCDCLHARWMESQRAA